MKRIYNLVTFISVSTILGSCSYLEKAQDVVLWAPKKTIEYSGKAWDATGGAVLDQPNDWQDDLVFGDRRPPVNNPNGYQQPAMGQPNPYANRGAPPIMSQGGGMPPAAYSGMQGGGYPTQGQQPIPMPQMPQGMYGSAMPQPMGAPGGYPPANRGFQPLPIDGGDAFDSPPVPQSQYYNQQQPYGGMGSMQRPISPQAPYGYGGQGQQSGDPYDMMQQNSPYAPARHKLIRKFEPMAAEHLPSTQEDSNQEVVREYQPLDLKVYMESGEAKFTDAQNNEHKIELSEAAKSKTMFPLEEYAPKSDVVITKTGEEQISDSNFEVQKLDDSYIPPASLPVEGEIYETPVIENAIQVQDASEPVEVIVEEVSANGVEIEEDQNDFSQTPPIAQVRAAPSNAKSGNYNGMRFLKKSRYGNR